MAQISKEQEEHLKNQIALILGLDPSNITIETTETGLRIDVLEPNASSNIAAFPSNDALRLLAAAGILGGMELGPKLLNLIKGLK